MNASPGEYVREIPLFPLNLVLFPHMLVPLHIFEERYKAMVNRCLEGRRTFGIVLATDEERTARVGCVARIARVERFPDGRMNIEVVGEERFRILDCHENQVYRTGVVEPFSDEHRLLENLAPLAGEVRALLVEFLTRHMERLGRRLTGFQLPDEPEMLSFLAACVLPIENPDKQVLLEYTDTAIRLGAVRDILEREVQKLQRESPASERVQWTPIDEATFTRYRCSN